MTTASSRGFSKVALLAAVVLATGFASAAAQSIGDRFKSLFGGSSDQSVPAPASPADRDKPPEDLTCPEVSIRAGASTYAVGLPGKSPAGNDLRFQATITRTARECNYQNGTITARIGIQGRVIAGPAGAPASVEVPLRVAVVQGGVSEKTIATKVFTTTVNMSANGSEPFTLVGEDVVYPAPAGAVADSYVFYIGFDPQALRPAPQPRAPRKK